MTVILINYKYNAIFYLFSQQQSKLMWSPSFHYNNGGLQSIHQFQPHETQTNSNGYASDMSDRNTITTEQYNELCDQFNELGLFSGTSNQQKSIRPPPGNYMCHLCFQKGHYIRDCPQVI